MNNNISNYEKFISKDHCFDIKKWITSYRKMEIKEIFFLTMKN